MAIYPGFKDYPILDLKNWYGKCLLICWLENAQMASFIEESVTHPGGNIAQCHSDIESEDQLVTQSPLIQNNAESSLSRRARFNEQPVEKSGWVEISQSEPQMVTFTGLVTRGQSQGQQVKVQLEMTRDKLAKFSEKEELSDDECLLGKRRGPHVLLLSFLFIPFSFVSSLCMSFYLGTLTWYNAVVYFSEEKSLAHKLLLCPILILTYPFTVGLSAIFLAFYSSIIQLSWYLNHWYREIRDLEKGLYGWVCNKFGISHCSPYSVIILNESGEIQVQ